MKKITLLFAFMIGICAFTKAQTNLKVLQSDQTIHAAGLDSTSNTTGVSEIIKIPGYFDMITIQTQVTKLTGTPGGTVKLYGSIDGIIYDHATTDSLAVANVSGAQVHTWKIVPSTFYYYKVTYAPSGTQTSTITSKALWRKVGQ